MNIRKFAFTLIELLVVIAIIAIIGALALPARAQNNLTLGSSVLQNNRWGTLTNATGGVITNTTSTTFATPGVVNGQTSAQTAFPIFSGRGMGFYYSARGTGVGTNATVTYGFDVTYDGTNWTSNQPYTFTVSTTGTNIVNGFTNILADRLDNAKYGAFTLLSGGTSGYNVTNLQLTWSAIPQQ